MRVIKDDDEKRYVIETLASKYSPAESRQSHQEEIEKFWKTLCILELDIKEITGKQAIELVKES